MTRKNSRQQPLELHIASDVARAIRQHARSSMKAEICGVLIGKEEDGTTKIEASIPGAKAVQAGTHVTFTQDTWEHIYAVKDKEYPDARIVGWYHSHPGFGVFLSDHDTFIHRNFFTALSQVAWVFDPQSDEEGCFGWNGDSLERLETIVFVDGSAGELAGETGKPEPMFSDSGEGEDLTTHKASGGGAGLGIAGTSMLVLTTFLAGFLICWFLFPHFVVVPVDPRTGQPIMRLPSAVGQPDPAAAPGAAEPTGVTAPAQGGSKGNP